MGFLDKVKATAKDLGKTAKDLKGDLEKSGVLDSLKGGQQSQQSQPQGETYYTPGSGADSAPYEDSEPWTNLQLIKERTGLDVATILSDEEVTRLTGITVERAGDDGGAENMTGPYWRGSFKKDTYQFSVFIFHDYMQDRTDDLGLTEDGGRTRMQETRAEFEGSEVPGVGDEAFTDGNYLFARRGRWTLMIEASGSSKDYDYAAAARNLAIQAFNNMPA